MSGDADTQLTVDDIATITLPAFGSQKIYVPDGKDEMKLLEESDLTYYMYMANEKIEETTGTSTTVSRVPRLFEVRSSIIYRSITVVDTKDLDLADSIPTCYFNLPKIPWQMVCEIDWFFREIHKIHGTESIVLLTYDEAIGGPEGWGFLVPDQENTAADCNYKPESVAGTYPDTASIVGSWHSHPLMSAYASGTDHKDQATFDGLHITSGWTANSDTEYYAEMQVGSMRWTFKSEILLDSAPKLSVSEEVTKLLDKVTKKTYTTSYGSGSSSPKSGGGYQSSLAPAGPTANRSNRLEPIVGLPKDAGKPSDITYVGRLKSKDETECPFCRVPIISIDVEWRMCSACHCFIALPGESLSDVLDQRKKSSLMTWDIDIEDNPAKPIAMWERDEDDNKITTVYEPDSSVKS